MTYPITWTHPDGRRIVVYADHKIRIGYRRAGALQPTTGPYTDEWPVLARSMVPSLTEVEWTASPGPEWAREDREAQATRILMDAANEAQELYSLDELEEYARTHPPKGGA